MVNQQVDTFMDGFFLDVAVIVPHYDELQTNGQDIVDQSAGNIFDLLASSIGYDSYQLYLLMTDDAMRHIRLFQIGDLFQGQFNG